MAHRTQLSDHRLEAIESPETALHHRTRRVRTVVATILSFNSLETFKKTLHAVVEQTHPITEVIVVDNGSGDGTPEWVEMNRALLRLPVHLIALRQNMGVGAGHSTAWKSATLRHPDVDAIWVLEHDCVPNVDCLDQLLHGLPSEQATVGVPVQSYPHRSKGRLARTRRRARRLRRQLASLSPSGRQRNHLRRLTFNGLLLPTSILARVGYPRTDFFVGLEDRDYALRLRRHGVRIIVVQEALVQHITVGHGDLPKDVRRYYSSRNQIYFDRVVAPAFAARVRAFARFILSIPMEWAAGNDLEWRYQALHDGLKGKLGPYKAEQAPEQEPGR